MKVKVKISFVYVPRAFAPVKFMNSSTESRDKSRNEIESEREREREREHKRRAFRFPPQAFAPAYLHPRPRR
jgi:hypothetical protein